MRTFDEAEEAPGGQWSSESVARVARLDQQRRHNLERLRLVMSHVIDQLAVLSSAALKEDGPALARGARELAALLADPILELSSVCQVYAELRQLVLAEGMGVARREVEPFPHEASPAATFPAAPVPAPARPVGRSQLGTEHEPPPPPRRRVHPRGEVRTSRGGR